MENNIFWSYKNAHFCAITVQTLSTKKGLKWDFCFNAKFVQICAVFLQNWPYFWLLEIFFSIFMGPSLYGKIMKFKKIPILTLFDFLFTIYVILKIWTWKLVWSDSVSYWDWILVGLVHTNIGVYSGPFRDSELHYQTRAGILNFDAPCFEWGEWTRKYFTKNETK